MKKFHILGCLLLLLALAATPAHGQARYGLVSYDSLLSVMPEYAKAQQQVAELKRKYQAEAQYNEESFKRLFAEFLQGQKDFPQTILLKRQRDLQEAMEKGIAFRQAADSLLAAAERDLCRPAIEILHTALDAVGKERGYDLIIDTDTATFPYVNPALSEDAMPYVLKKILPTTTPKP